MSNERDVFNFHLNESLYFEKGQEVLQMVGISLDPDISIQPYDDYVSIRGVMELRGEYEKDPLIKQMETEPVDFEDHSRRYVEKIETTTDNFAAFSHRFPVEISVPTYRIESIDDITVDIASFDYELPDANHLKLTSTITIHGIQDQVSDRDDVGGGEETHEGVSELEPTDHFEFELTTDALNDETESPETSDNPEQNPTDKLEDPDRWQFTKTESLESFFNKEDKAKVKDKQSTENSEDMDPLPDEHPEIAADDSINVEEVANTELETEVEQQEIAEDNQELSEDSDEEIDRQTDIEDSASYLSTLFRDEEVLEEDHYTQMRLCIVQDHDTLETIAERYDISKLQILKQNRLHDDEISTGQLLSIPVQTK